MRLGATTNISIHEDAVIKTHPYVTFHESSWLVNRDLRDLYFMAVLK